MADRNAGTITVIVDRNRLAVPHVHRDFRCKLCYCDAHQKPHLHAPTCDPYQFIHYDTDEDE